MHTLQKMQFVITATVRFINKWRYNLRCGRYKHYAWSTLLAYSFIWKESDKRQARIHSYFMLHIYELTDYTIFWWCNFVFIFLIQPHSPFCKLLIWWKVNEYVIKVLISLIDLSGNEEWVRAYNKFEYLIGVENNNTFFKKIWTVKDCDVFHLSHIIKGVWIVEGACLHFLTKKQCVCFCTYWFSIKLD